MSWTVTFFDSKVEAQALALPTSILANFLHVLEMIQDFGPALGKPHTAPMGAGLFEIRAKGKEGIGRALFCIAKDREIVILNIFTKKTQRTPRQEIDKARRRMKEIG